MKVIEYSKATKKQKREIDNIKRGSITHQCPSVIHKNKKKIIPRKQKYKEEN